MHLTVLRLMLNFTMHAAGNELIFFYRYRGTTSSYRYRGIILIFLPLPREYRRNFPIYRGTAVTAVLPFSPLPCHSLPPLIRSGRDNGGQENSIYATFPVHKSGFSVHV